MNIGALNAPPPFGRKASKKREAGLPRLLWEKYGVGFGLWRRR